jgi:hypothetical protein
LSRAVPGRLATTLAPLFSTATTREPSWGSTAFAIGDVSSSAKGVGFEYGDYSGLAYADGVINPIWVDTSKSATQDLKDTTFEAMTDRVTENENVQPRPGAASEIRHFPSTSEADPNSAADAVSPGRVIESPDRRDVSYDVGRPSSIRARVRDD